MSENGPEPTAAERNHAAALADTAATKLIAAKVKLTHAVEGFEDADRMLRRSEDEINELEFQSIKVRESEPDELGWRLAQAGDLAQDADRRLTQAAHSFGQLDADLTEASQHLVGADRALDELEQLPGGRTDQTSYLRHRLRTFREAVQVAGEDLEQAQRQLGTARTNLGPLLDVPRDQDADRAAHDLRLVGSELNGQVNDLRRGLAGPREEVEAAESGAGPAAAESAELAATMQAAANPTPASRSVTPGSTEQSTLRQRLEGGAERDHQRDNS